MPLKAVPGYQAYFNVSAIVNARRHAVSTAVGRLEGYYQALAKHDLSQFQGYVLAGRSVDVDSWIWAAQKRQLAQPDQPTKRKKRKPSAAG